ncbi:MAG: head-tail connector protein [Lachnotalea sp.]
MADETTTITLKDAKEYLRVGFDEDDDQIDDLILTAEAYIDSCVGTAYKDKSNYESEEDYKKGQRIAILLQKKIIKDMYDERGTEIPGSTKEDKITRTILDKLANVGAE